MALEAVLGTCWETGVGLKAGPGRGLGVATERRAKQEGGTGTMGSLACTRLCVRAGSIFLQQLCNQLWK